LNAISAEIHSVAIQSRDFDKALHFYAHVLGLPIVVEPYEFKKKRILAWLDAGTCLLELYSNKLGDDPVAWDPKGVGPVNLAFAVDSLDDVITLAKQENLRIIKPPFIPPSGDPNQPRVMFISGPDDEQLLFRERSAASDNPAS